MFLIIYQDVVEYQPKKTLRDDEREKDLVRLFNIYPTVHFIFIYLYKSRRPTMIGKLRQ